MKIDNETSTEPVAGGELAETPTTGETRSDYSSLQAEASRLLNFKRQHIRNQNQTPCPACTTLVHINSRQCPHCNSDIAAHTALAREELRKLNAITAELYELHKRQGGHHSSGSSQGPFWKRFISFFSDPQLREDAKVVLPSLLLFFVLIVSLRVMGNWLLFWSVALVGGAFAFVLLKRSSFRRHVTIDLYRAVLVFGLAIVLSTAVGRPTSSGPRGLASKVRVQRPVVNIRASATTDSRVVTTARKGDRLSVLDRQGSWYKIQTAEGQTGWVYAELVK